MEGFKKCQCLVFSLALFSFIWFGFASPASVNAEVQWQEDTIIINNSPEEIEEVVLKCWDFKHLFKYVTKSQRLSRNQCYLEATVLGKTAAWMKIQIDPKRVDADGKTTRFTVRMLDGNIDFFEAQGKLTKLGKRKTLVSLRVKADPGIMGVPDSIIENEIRKMIRRALVKLNVRMLVGKY